MTTIRFWLGICLAGSVSLASAEGKPAAGEEKSAACAGCHGMDGNGSAPIFPKLAGQHQAYLEKQLDEFKSKKRVEPTMNAMTESLSQQDIEDIAAFYAVQKTSIETGERNTLGEKIYRGGNTATGVPACSACHGPTGSGNPKAHFPLIHGQFAAYVEKILNDFKSGERGNDASGIMRSAAAKLSEAEISAVADYVSTLKP